MVTANINYDSSIRNVLVATCLVIRDGPDGRSGVKNGSCSLIAGHKH